MENRIISKITLLIAIIVIGLTSCSSFSSSNSLSQPNLYQRADPHLYNTALWEGSSSLVWEKLHRLSSARLAEMQNKTDDPTKMGWIQLASISKRNSTNNQELVRELVAWREKHPVHPANQLLPNAQTLGALINASPPQHIAILLPQTGTYGSAGALVREGFLNAYYANLPNVVNQNIKFYDTSQTTNLASLYQQAVSEGADFVIGPLTKEEVGRLGGSTSFHIPTLTLNYNEVRKQSSRNLFEYGLLPEDEAIQLADRALQAGHLNAIIIAPQNSWGKRMVSAFARRWQIHGGSIKDTWFFTANANFNNEVAHLLNVNPNTDKQLMRVDNHKSVLEQQRRHDFDVIFLFSPPKEARTIVASLRYYYTGDIPIYAPSSVYSGKPNPTKDADLNGVIVCDIPWTMKKINSSGNNAQSERLYAVGQDAYLLSQTLNRLKELPHFPIYGSTGALTLSTDHQIHRRLPCNMMRNGLL